MDIFCLKEYKFPPYKGTYLRPAYENSLSTLLFDHLINDLDVNKAVYGLPLKEYDKFVFLAEMHGIEEVKIIEEGF